MDSKQGTDALFLYASEGILVVDQRGEIVRINPSAEQLFGYEKDELLGSRIEVLVPNRFSSEHDGYRDKYGKNPHARTMGAGLDLFALKKDGTEFPVEISLSPYSTGEGKFVIAFIVDITIRKLAEASLKDYSIELQTQVKNRTVILEEAIEELEKTKRELNNALEKERELNELKSRFVSMASHEFRTPLTTMMSSLSLVTKFGELDDKENQGKYLGKIKQSINNLTDILNDFLSVSKLEEGKVQNMPEEMNLKTFTEDIIMEMQSFGIEDRQFNYVHSGKNWAKLDKKLLKNVLFNLISNAVKFSPIDKAIDISTEVTETQVKVIVTDYGIGISSADQKHLFERFFRGQNATYIQGTGLGLNIVAKYVELMDAVLHFKSVEYEGTTFEIAFPQ